MMTRIIEILMPQSLRQGPCDYFVFVFYAALMRLFDECYELGICQTLGVKVISGVLSSNHVHMFVEIPPKLSVSVKLYT